MRTFWVLRRPWRCYRISAVVTPTRAHYPFPPAAQLLGRWIHRRIHCIVTTNGTRRRLYRRDRPMMWQCDVTHRQDVQDLSLVSISTIWIPAMELEIGRFGRPMEGTLKCQPFSKVCTVLRNGGARFVVCHCGADTPHIWTFFFFDFWSLCSHTRVL
jgi:hypothetical protein